MLSEAPATPSRFAWLRSQGLGIACGLSTVFLFTVGSFVMAATSDEASAGIGMDDVRTFFERPSIAHLWFYLLLPVLSLYALNTVLATWDNVSRKIRSGIRAPSAYAPAVVHLAFLVALLAHAVGGLMSEERGQVILGVEWSRLPDGREARVLSIETDQLPDGMPKAVRAQVEVRDEAGSTSRTVVGYNEPLSRGLGKDLYLLIRELRAPTAVTLAVGDGRCTVQEGAACAIGTQSFELLRLMAHGRRGPGLLARVRVIPAKPSAPHELWLVPGMEADLPDGGSLRIAGVESQPLLILRARLAPGNPWALVAALLLVAGLVLMWRRFLPRGNER
jgi:hypothetical protein